MNDILHPQPVPPSEAEPVFILGSVRSGTSMLVNALRQGAGIPGFNEGNIISLMQRMLDQIEEHFRKLAPEYLAKKDMHLVARMDESALRTYIINWFAATYAAEQTGSRWVDKSPDSYLFAPMIRATPLLLEMFPRARFLFCIRRGIENVMSRLRKFPNVPFGFACRSWAHTVDEWLKVKPVLEDRGMEVYQRDMAIRPGETAAAIASFLELDQQQEQAMARMFAGRRFEQSQAASEHRELALDQTPWDEGFRAAFVKWCSEAMEAMGFTMEGEVFDVAAPLRLFVPTVDSAVESVNVPDGGFRRGAEQELEMQVDAGPGSPAEVRYLGVQLHGQTRFSAELSLDRDPGGPVRFGVRLENPGTREVLGGSQKEVEGTDPVPWQIEHPSLMGSYDLVITVEPTNRVSGLVARWKDPVLL